MAPPSRSGQGRARREPRRNLTLPSRTIVFSPTGKRVEPTYATMQVAGFRAPISRKLADAIRRRAPLSKLIVDCEAGLRTSALRLP